MDWNEIPEVRGEPDFDNLLAVLRREEPSRPTLFEFFLNEPLYERLLGDGRKVPSNSQERVEAIIQANRRVGYDYVTLIVPGFSFVLGPHRSKGRTVSLNEGSLIHSREDFDAYPWPDPDAVDYDVLNRLESALPDGMKLIPYGPNGVLENVTDLVGYEDLCMLIKDDPQLAEDIFEAVGTRLIRYYQRAACYDSVGACISNDDWGFKTQTMFSPKDMRRFVFPWHKRIVETIHASGKPVILHSCGYFDKIIEDVIEDMKFDGRHSYEDNIVPVEEAYERYHDRMATLGGIDVDFICRSSPQAVYDRSKAMLERSEGRGSYALGTGNSVPDYVPDAGYFAMIRAALDLW
jgi:uroporphyrinogen decarboxylase